MLPERLFGERPIACHVFCFPLADCVALFLKEVSSLSYLVNSTDVPIMLHIWNGWTAVHLMSLRILNKGERH